MKQKLKLILIFAVIFSSGAIAQKRNLSYPSNKKTQLFGIHFNVGDFNAAKAFSASDNTGSVSTVKDMALGMGLSYWKGITPKIDFSLKLNGMFYDYSAKQYGQTGKTEIGIELEPTINVRLLNDDNIWNGFLTTGLGGGLYTNHIGSYVPLGGGIQFNGKGLTYLFIQAAYRASLTKKVIPDHLFYSLGLAQSFGEDKPKMPPPPPPLPVVEAPKDRDGDGVLDVDDKCPDVKGLASLQGCPDQDGDGIADAEDKCPTIPGLAKYNGCPIPDTDKDGINDEEDKCPTTPGFARYNGCPIPDTDGDGVNDEEDKCPTVPGVASNAGCPEIKKDVIEKVNVAAKNIFFQTGSNKLLAKSNAAMNNIVKLLADNPSYMVEIGGHTDNTGTAAKNQALSEARGNAVKDYLVKKGVDASRINVTGYGPDKPIADNKTAAGRAKNRRVELELKNN
ncbi:MAG: OmpA family protein [Ferruginibacter sp.]